MTPILCYVTDSAALAEPRAETLLAVIRRAVSADVDWIQIREKNFSGRELSVLAHEAVTAARETSTQILINGRLDVAIAAGAGGVHLGGDALPVADVAAWIKRRGGPVWPPSEGPRAGAPLRTDMFQNASSFLIGASCHSLEEAQAAERDGADYVFFGPIFTTPEKIKYGPPQGVARLAEASRAVRIPVLAIGGITPENFSECLRAGAAGIAAIRMFQESTDMAELVEKLRANGNSQ